GLQGDFFYQRYRMKSPLILLLFFLLSFGSVAATNSPVSGNGMDHDRMAWWRDARFGMFIHWGLYSEAAGYWDGKPTPGAGEWIMNDMQIPLSQYAKLVPRFDPEQFNAEE